MSVTALKHYLDPLETLLNEKVVNEIIINQPGEIWVERKGKFTVEQAPELDFNHLKSMIHLIGESTHQIVDETHPLLAATLPNGCRVQCVLPPACPKENVCIAIRRQTHLNMTLSDYAKEGAFDYMDKESNKVTPVHHELRTIYHSGQFEDFIRHAVRNKVTTVISGGTSTGKTTFLNSCLSEIEINERIVTIEDAREVFPQHENIAHLIYSKGGQGISNVGPQELLEASLRLRPDRIILGELRGSEAYTFLRAINTGHEGSISSVHADTPRLAYEQIALMVMQAGLGLERSEIVDYVKSIIPIIVQLKRNTKGMRYISEIHYERLQ